MPTGFCNHNQLPNAPEVHVSVKKAIELYLASIAMTMHKASGGVVIPMQPGWEVTQQDARTTIIRDTNHCNKELDESMEPYRARIEKSKLWCAGMAITNLAAPQTEASDGVACDNDGQSQGVTVGGVSATFTKRTGCSNSIVVGKSSLRSWNVSSKKVVIDVYDLPGNVFHGANVVVTEFQWS